MYARILPPDVTRSVAGGASAELDGMDVATDNSCFPARSRPLPNFSNSLNMYYNPAAQGKASLGTPSIYPEREHQLIQVHPRRTVSPEISKFENFSRRRFGL